MSPNWRCWLPNFGTTYYEPPPEGIPIALSRDFGKTIQAIVLREELDPMFNVANLWWRPWPEDGDL